MNDPKRIELCLRDRDAGGAIVAWCVGYSNEDIDRLLKKHPSWYRSSEEI